MYHLVDCISSECMSWEFDTRKAALNALFFLKKLQIPHKIARNITCAALKMAAAEKSGRVVDACAEMIYLVVPHMCR